MKLNILYIVNKHKVNKKGLCPLTCRLSFSNHKKHFATGLFVNSDNWQSKQQLVKPPEPDAELINSQLSLIKTKLSQAFLFLQVNEASFTVQDIYNQYKGEPLKKERGVVEVYNMHSARIKKLIGIDIKYVTYQKYLESGVHLKGFIKHKVKAKDIQFKAIKSSFLEQYKYYLKTKKPSAKHLKQGYSEV